jgi:hypothetical protein
MVETISLFSLKKLQLILHWNLLNKLPQDNNEEKN